MVAWWLHIVTQIWVNIGSGNGLLPAGTKPLPGPLLTYHQENPVSIILGHCHKIWRYQSIKQDSTLLFIILPKASIGSYISFALERQQAIVWTNGSLVTDTSITHLDLALFSWSPTGAVRDIEEFEMHICITRRWKLFSSSIYVTPVQNESLICYFNFSVNTVTLSLSDF